MKTTKLVTTYKPRPHPIGADKRKVKQSHRIQMDQKRVTYRETFNTINSTLARYGTLGITLKECNPTIMNINCPYITLLNNIMSTINDTYGELNKDLHALDTHQQDAHDTQLIQTYEYRRHHTTLNTDKYTPTPTQSTASDLIDTSHAIVALAATINTSHITKSTQMKYDNWTPTLPPIPVFLLHDTPTDIYRKRARLHIVNILAVRTLIQVRQRLIFTIMRQRTDTVNHDINST